MNLFGAPAHVDGHVRLRDAEGVPEGRGHGGPGTADRGQVAPAGPAAWGWVTDRWTPGFDTVLVVDFGAQYAQLIARRVREADVYSEIVPHTITAAELAARAPAGVILRGGPKSVHVDGAPSLDPAIYELGVPILGICYGAQLVAQQLGGEVGPHRPRASTAGPSSTSHARPSLLGADQPADQHDVWMSHFDSIVRAPDGFVVTASHAPTRRSPRWRTPAGGIYGVQFHPEVVHTPHGQERAASASSTTCAAAAPTWTMALGHRRRRSTPIRAQVGDGRAICGLSGGVDSAVAAALVHRAIGPQLTCVYVDTGLMRKGEGEQVVETFRRHQGIELIHVDAGDRFFERLAGVTEPEEKRKAIGELFIRVFEENTGGLDRRRASSCRARSTPTSSSAGTDGTPP